MSEHEMFKTTLMGGYDKDDVAEQVRNMKDAHISNQAKLQKELISKDSEIAELKARLEEKERQKEKLENDISQKYQKYIDHHDSISNLLVDAQIKANEIISDAKAKKEQMLELTDKEIKRKFESVQAEVNEKIAEGKRKYIALQSEMDSIMELINQAQKRFVVSYKEIHKIISSMPERVESIDEDNSEDSVNEE